MATFFPICLSVFALSLAAAPVQADLAADAYREARVHLAARRYAEAAARFEAAAAATNSAAAAAAWFGRGEALYGLRQWDAALAAYGTVLDRFPASPLAPQALYARGHAEQQAGRLPQALAAFTAFKDRYPAHALTPSCLSAIGKISDALEAQARQQALAAIARELAAVNALVRAEKFAEAGAAADRFLLDHPGHSQTAELRYLGAACAYRAKAFDRAADAFRAFLDRHPQHARSAEARSQLGDSLFQAGRYDEARGLFEKMAAEAPDPQEEARLTLALGDCHAAQQKWDEAEHAYLSVEVLQGSDALRPVALKRLADLYEKRGQPDQARRTREDLRRRYPGSE